MASPNESIIVIKVDTSVAQKNIGKLKVEINDLKNVNASVSTSFDYSKDIEKTNKSLSQTIKSVYDTGKSAYEVGKSIAGTFLTISDAINQFTQTYALLGSNKLVLGIVYSYARAQILDIILEPFLTIPDIVNKSVKDVNAQLVKAGGEIATAFNNTILTSFKQLPNKLNMIFSALTMERIVITTWQDMKDSLFGVRILDLSNIEKQFTSLRKYKELYNKEINDIIKETSKTTGYKFINELDLKDSINTLKNVFGEINAIVERNRIDLLKILDNRDLLLRMSVYLQSLAVEFEAKISFIDKAIIQGVNNIFLKTRSIIFSIIEDFFVATTSLFKGNLKNFSIEIIDAFKKGFFDIPLALTNDIAGIFKTLLVHLEATIIKYYRNTNFASVFLLIVNDLRNGLQLYINAVNDIIMNVDMAFRSFSTDFDPKNIITSFRNFFNSLINETSLFSNRIVDAISLIAGKVWTEFGIVVKSFSFGLAYGFMEVSKLIDSGTNLLLGKVIDTAKQNEVFNSLLNASRNMFFSYQKLFTEFLDFVNDFFDFRLTGAIRNGLLVAARIFTNHLYSTLDVITYFSVSLQNLLYKAFSSNKITEAISLVFQNILSAVNVILVPSLEKIAIFSNNLDGIIDKLINTITKFNYSEYFVNLGKSIAKFGDDLLYTINKYTGAVDFLKILSKTAIETGSIIGNSIRNIGRLMFGLTQEVAKNTFTLLGAFIEYSRVLRSIFSGTFLEEFRSKIQTALSSALAGGLGMLAFFKIGEKKQELIQLGDQLNKTAISISNFVGGLDRAQQILSEIQKYSAENPLLNTEQLLEATKLLVNYGIEADKIVQITKEVAQVSSAVGSNLDEVARIYGQVISKGQLYAEELQQFAERGVPIIKVFSEILGVSTREFQEMMRQGKITSDVFVELFSKMANSSEYFGGIIEKQSQTITGIMAGINDNIKIIAQSFGAILGDMLMPFASVMLKITDAIRNFVLFLKNLYFSLNETTRAFIGTIGTIISFTAQVILLGSSIFMMYRGFKILTTLLPFFTGIVKSIITSLTSLISVQSIYITQQEKIILVNALQTFSFKSLLIVLQKVIVAYGLLMIKVLVVASIIAGLIALIYKYVEAKREQEDALKKFINEAGGLDKVVFQYDKLNTTQKDYIRTLELQKRKQQEIAIMLANQKKAMQELAKSFENTIAVSNDLQKRLVKINAIKMNQKGDIIFNPELIKNNLDKMLFYLTYFGVVIWEFFKRTDKAILDTFITIWEISKQIVVDTGKTFIKLGEIIFNALTGNIQKSKQAFEDLANIIADTTHNISNQFTSYLSSTGNQFYTLFSDSLQQTNDLFSKYKVISNVVDKNTAQQQLDDLKNKTIDTFNQIQEESVIEINLQISDDKVRAVKEILDRAFLSLSAFNIVGFSNVEGALSSLGERAFKFSGVADDIATKLANVNLQLSSVDKNSQAFQSLKKESEELQGSLSKLKADFGNSFSVVIQSLVNGLQDLFKAMESNMNALRDFQNRMMDWVNYIYDGFLDNLNGYYDSLRDKNKETYDAMLDDINNFYEELKILENEEYQKRKAQIEQEYALKKQQLKQELQDRLAKNEALSLTSYEQMTNEAIIYEDYKNQLEALEQEKEQALQEIRDAIRQENQEKETEYLNNLAEQYGIYDQQQWEYLSNEEKRKLIEQQIKEEQAKKDKQLEEDKLKEEKRLKRERATFEYMMTLAQFNMQKMMSLLNLRVQLALAMANIMAGVSMAIAQTGIFSFMFVPMILGLGAMIYSQITGAMGMVASIPPPPPPKELTMQEGGFVDSTSRRETYDNIPARLQAGEFVINREKTKQLYEAIDTSIERNSVSGNNVNVIFEPQSIYIQGVVDDALIDKISTKITYKVREALI